MNKQEKCKTDSDTRSYLIDAYTRSIIRSEFDMRDAAHAERLLQLGVYGGVFMLGFSTAVVLFL